MSRPTAVGSCTSFCPAVHDFHEFIFDVVGVPITMVPSVPEKDNFLHGCITYALKMYGSYAIPSVSILYLCIARYS